MDFGWVNAAARDLARPIPGPISDRVAALSKALGVHLCIGLTEKVEGGICDSAILAGPDGEDLLRHRKINNLAELKLIEPPYIDGRVEDIGVAETPIGRIGVLICADTFVEANLVRMRSLAPDLVLVPYGWAAPRSPTPTRPD